MPTPIYPSWNDKEYDLLKKMTENTALIADYEIGDVASVAGTAGNVLVNGGTAAATGAITLSLPSAIRVADGTLSAPVFSFSADSDTGLFRAASGSVAYASNGLRTFAFPTVTGSSGQFLTTDGAGNITWGTGSGTLPSQTGNAGKLLTTDGVNASWSSSLSGNLTATDYLLGTGRSFTSAVNSRGAAGGLVLNGSGPITVSGVTAFGVSDYSTALWINSPTLPVSYLYSSQTDHGSAVLRANGSVEFYSNNTGPVAPAGSVVAGRDTLVVFVRSNGTETVYVNGAAVATKTQSAGNCTNALTKVGSSFAGTSIYSGDLRVKVWNRGLSSTEVAALWQDGRAPGADYNSASNTAINTSTWISTGGGAFTTFSGASATGFTAARASGTGYANLAPDQAMTPGQRVRISGSIVFNNGKTVIPVIYAGNGGSTALVGAATNQSFTVEATCTLAGTTIYIGATGDSDFTLSSLVVTRLGLVLSPDLTAGTGTTAYPEAGTSGTLTWTTGVSWATPQGTTVPFQNVLASGNLTVSGTGNNIFNSGGGNVLIGTTTDGGQKLQVNGAATFAGAIAIGNTVNTVSPTSPNRTITMVIGGVTYYLHAKTTND